jgi:hypothetical protein
MLPEDPSGAAPEGWGWLRGALLRALDDGGLHAALKIGWIWFMVRLDMAERALRDVAPSLYRAYLPAFFDHEAPREEKATCGACVMLPPKDEARPLGITYFLPETKCCTFHPTLPNYLVGAALADARPEMEEGKRRLRGRIASRVAVSPRWLAAPRKFDLLLKGSWTNTMGRSLMMRCPLYSPDHGGCTIWPHWEGVCATFFCKYMAAADGEAFWRSIRMYLSYVQRALSLAAARAFLPGHDEPAPFGKLTLEDLEDRPPTEESYGALWQDWASREEELYLACHAWVKALDREDFERVVGGPEHDERLAAVLHTHDLMVNPRLPETLVKNPKLDERPREDGVLVTGYSHYEPLLLTKDLYAVTRVFDGTRRVAEVRAQLKRDEDLEVPEEILLGLYRYRVLVTPAQAAAIARG